MLRLVALFVGLTLSAGLGIAQVVVTPVPSSDGSTANRTSEFPEVVARVQVLSGGASFQPPVSAIWIVDGTRPVQPTSVTPHNDGSVSIRWIGTSASPALPSSQVIINSRIVVQDRGATGQATVQGSEAFGPRLFWTDAQNRNEVVPVRYDFGRHAVGTTDTAKLRLVVFKGFYDGERELPVRVDSIRTRNPQFKVLWRGSLIDPRPAPPANLTAGFDYRVDVAFEPTSDETVIDTLVVYHSGSLREHIILMANRAPYKRLQKIFLLAPNSAEVFAPCQEVDIHWRGTLPGFQSYLDYTLDDGATWNFIDSTLDSSYVWTVPDRQSNVARIRVTQRFQSTPQRSVVGQRIGASAVTFDASGSFLAIAYQNGAIMEFDAETLEAIRTFSVQGSGSAVQIAYAGTSRSIVVLVRRQGGSRDALQRFDLGTNVPAASVDLESGFAVAGFGVEQSGSVLYAWSQLAGDVRTYDASTFVAGQPLVLDLPLASAAVNRDELAVTYINGSIARYRLPDLTRVQILSLDHSRLGAPIINRISVAPSKRFAVLSAQADPPGITPLVQPSYIYDLVGGRLVDIITQSTVQSVTGIGFTGSENTIILGMNDGTAMRAYDLEALRLYNLPGSGHFQSVTGLAISPNGSTYISISSDRDPDRNALLRTIATPEWDESDVNFAIRTPQASSNDIVLAARLVGTSIDTTITRGLCNTGQSPIIITSARLIRGNWCTLDAPITGDTILPGTCLPLKLRAVALDTGLIVDTLLVRTCETEFRIAVMMRGIDRNLTMLGNDTDFGDVCVGNRTRLRIRAIRNNDNIPVTINRMVVQGGLFAHFRVATVIRDTVIPPGGTLEVDVEFYPSDLGPDSAVVVVGYERSRSERFIRMYGRGVGVIVESSHAALPFLEGNNSRTVVLRNNAPYPATVVRADVSTGAPFTTSPTVPVTIEAGDSVTMTLTYTGGDIPADARVRFGYAPCGVDTEIRLMHYRGSAVVTLPRVTADPRLDVDLPIHIELTEDVPYQGVRPFELTMLVNPRIFLARQVTSAMGAARIISQDIVDGMRHVRIAVDGNFRSGEAVRINGWAGMAEVDVSPLLPYAASAPFGVGIPATFVAGEIKIIGLDPDRRIVPPLGLFLEGVYPNPTSTGAIRVEVQRRGVQGTQQVALRVLDMRGQVVLPETSVDVEPGGTVVTIDVSTLPPGAYSVVALFNGKATSLPFVVL